MTPAERARRVRVFREASDAAMAWDRQLVADLKAALTAAYDALDAAERERDAARLAVDRVADIAGWVPKPATPEAFERLARATLSPRGRAAQLVRGNRLLHLRLREAGIQLRKQGVIIDQFRDKPINDRRATFTDAEHVLREQLDQALQKLSEANESLNATQDRARTEKQRADAAEATVARLRGALEDQIKWWDALPEIGEPRQRFHRSLAMERIDAALDPEGTG